MITKVKIHVDYYHGNDNDQFNIVLKAWGGLITYKKEYPIIKVDKESPAIVVKEKTKTGEGENETTKQQQERKIDKEEILKSIDDMKVFIEHVVGLHKLVRSFLGKITIKKFEWHTLIGIGEAMSTAVLCGAVWSAKGGIIGIISNYFRLAVMPVVSVTPNFNQFTSQIQLKCIFQFRIGNAILAGMKLVKYWKGGRPNFKTKPLAVLSSDKTKTV